MERVLLAHASDTRSIRAAERLARRHRDAGDEVVLLEPGVTGTQTASAAVAEDATQVVGIGFDDGWLREAEDSMTSRGVDDVPVDLQRP